MILIYNYLYSNLNFCDINQNFLWSVICLYLYVVFHFVCS